MTYRLGIDVGGTFTDLVLLDDALGQLVTEKVLTTQEDPWLGIQRGVRALAARGHDLLRIVSIIHGTTLVSNALIERRGARVGLLTTRGFRDTLYFRREFRYDIYDPNIVLPEPLVPRHLRREVRERIAGDGSELEALDKGHARAEVRELLSDGVEALAVCLLHAYLQPDHELALRNILAEEAPEHPVSLSHEVLPQIREYERSSATVINAYVQPIIRRYLRRLQDGLKAENCGGELHLMTSSGGTMSVETAEAFPIHLVESGPVAGTLIASLIGTQADEANILSFDMGGTTAKACVIRSSKPLISKDQEVARVRRFKKGSGLPLGIPVIDLLEIGAGGGSIAEIDALGLLRVGPQSAGADPGPVCYGRGGTEPTVTDANVVLGLINPKYFLGGAMTLDRQAAAQTLEERIGRPLDLNAEQAAEAIHRVVTESMAEAAQVHAAEVNVDIRRFAMVAFGGAGPIHAHGVAERLHLPFIVCPRHAGVLSALGLLTAPLAFEFSRSLNSDLDDLNVETVNSLLEELESQGRQLLSEAGVHDIRVQRSVDMCYVGQRYEVTTPVRPGQFGRQERVRLKELFDKVYEEAYGRSLSNLPARCITWRVLTSGPKPHVSLRPDHRDEPKRANIGRRDSALKGTRRAVIPDFGAVDCAVYMRQRLLPGDSFMGPALVEEVASTTVVPPKAMAEVDTWGNLIIRRQPPR